MLEVFWTQFKNYIMKGRMCLVFTLGVNKLTSANRGRWMSFRTSTNCPRSGWRWTIFVWNALNSSCDITNDLVQGSLVFVIEHMWIFTIFTLGFK